MIVVAPDSFKGTLSAREVANALARGLRATGPDVLELPVGDGGEGTMDVLVAVLGGELRTAVVSDPLGRPVEAAYALLPHGETAIVETAQASGLWRVAERERDAWASSTRGTGELIAAAARAGASKVIVTVGGSATTDGGIGAIEALDQAGVDVELHVLCDVRSTWEEAPRLYGPQKGADPATVARLERRLDEVAETAPRDPRGVPHTGPRADFPGVCGRFKARTSFQAPPTCSTRSGSMTGWARRRPSSPAKVGSTRRPCKERSSPRSPCAAGQRGSPAMQSSAKTSSMPTGSRSSRSRAFAKPRPRRNSNGPAVTSLPRFRPSVRSHAVRSAEAERCEERACRWRARSADGS
jgi:hypothetical protein